MKNLLITLIITLVAVLNVACTGEKVEAVQSVDTVKMFNDAIESKDSKTALKAIALDAEKDSVKLNECKQDTITKMSKFIDSDDYVVTYEALNAQCSLY